MSKIIVAILISPCISAADVDVANRSTDIKMCPNTVEVIKREITGINYGYYRQNFFRLRKVVIAENSKPMLR